MSGRCIAGKVKEGQQYSEWLRPVSERPSREISEEERWYQDGTDPKVLDLIAVTLKCQVPENFQTENHLIDDGFYWEKRGRATWREVLAAVDSPASLWVDGQSTYNGLNDKIDIGQANKLMNSLVLIMPTDLKLHVAPEGYLQQKRQVRASFEYGSTRYRLKVTDPVVERRYLQGDNGDYAIAQAALCVSLGEEFQGHTYKLVAAVVLPE